MQVLMHTRDNKLKIYQDHVHYNLRKYFFANRVICTWNTLPDSVIEAILIVLIVSTRSQAVARIADRTDKNCKGHVT